MVERNSMRNVGLKEILKPILGFLERFKKPKQKTSTITIINNGNIVININDVNVNAKLQK